MFKEVVRDLIYPVRPEYTEKDYPDLRGKVYIVTGASSGIGLATAKLLVAQGAAVYISGRTPAKIAAALEELRDDAVPRRFAGGRAELLDMQHEDFASIRRALAAFRQRETRLDGIVHNAGINFRGPNIVRGLGVIDIIVINVLAAQLIQQQLADILGATAGARVVWLTSAIHFFAPANGGIDWEGMNTYDSGGLLLGTGNGMYGQTKAMNIYQAVLWGQRLPGVVSVAVHPGVITSSIRRSNRWRELVLGSIARPAVWGAYQVCELLLKPGITPSAASGGYFVPFGTEEPARADVAAGARGANGQRFWDWANEKIAPAASSSASASSS